MAQDFKRHENTKQGDMQRLKKYSFTLYHILETKQQKTACV